MSALCILIQKWISMAKWQNQSVNEWLSIKTTYQSVTAWQMTWNPSWKICRIHLFGGSGQFLLVVLGNTLSSDAATTEIKNIPAVSMTATLSLKSWEVLSKMGKTTICVWRLFYGGPLGHVWVRACDSNPRPYTYDSRYDTILCI